MAISINGETAGTRARPARELDEPSDVVFERGCAPVVKAGKAELRNAAAGIVFAKEDVAIDRAIARDILGGGAITVTQAAAGIVLAGGNATVRQAGAGTIASLGNMEIAQGGACCLAAGSATVSRGGTVLLAITPRLEVAEGGRVFGGPVAAIAAIAGIAVGIAIGRFALGRGR